MQVYLKGCFHYGQRNAVVDNRGNTEARRAVQERIKKILDYRQVDHQDRYQAQDRKHENKCGTSSKHNVAPTVVERNIGQVAVDCTFGAQGIIGGA